MSEPRSSSSEALRPCSSAEIDASCRLPLFVMFVSAAVWLAVGSAFALISTLKFHNPNFLADAAWLTYGRVRPAYLNAALYGFCLQAGLGVTLWIIARLGRTVLTQRWVVTLGAALWNLGVGVGIIGILAGDSTGFEYLEMPRYAAAIIFLGYLLIGIWSVLLFHYRSERRLFVSQWFLLAALFWFPWIYSTTYLLLVTFPVRGVEQAVIAWWFSQNLLVVWLGLVGLAAVFYFVPKLARSELQSRYLALLTFWMLILCGSWGGIPNSAPVPAWMPALSASATILMLIPILTVGLGICWTVKGRKTEVKSSVPLQFILIGVVGFLLGSLMNFSSVLPQITEVTNFTWFTVARTQAGFYGFFSLVMFGAIYYILPHLAGIEFCSAKLVRAHLWVAGFGILLVVAPLALGGLVQGLKLGQASIPFLDVSKATLPFLRASTMGDLLIAAGHGIFLLNLGGIVYRFALPRAEAAYAAGTTDLYKTAEVKA